MAARLRQRQTLHQLKVTVPAPAEEAASALLENLFAQWPVSFSRPESSRVELALFLPQNQRPARATLLELADRLRALEAWDVRAGNPKVEVAPLANRNWKDSWKRHFKPLEIGRQLLIRPSWSRRRPRPGQAVVVLDPGLSFGTGQHPTTAFCLHELVRSRRSNPPQAFLDIGTGSGILAIAAAKLGYRPIHAFDNDPDAVRVASTNARRNRVAHKIRFRRANLSELPRRVREPYDLVCANLLADLLIQEADRILHRVKPGGRLVIAGILRSEFAGVNAHFTSRGARRLRSVSEGEWQSGSYRFLT